MSPVLNVISIVINIKGLVVLLLNNTAKKYWHFTVITMVMGFIAQNDSKLPG